MLPAMAEGEGEMNHFTLWERFQSLPYEKRMAVSNSCFCFAFGQQMHSKDPQAVGFFKKVEAEIEAVDYSQLDNQSHGIR